MHAFHECELTVFNHLALAVWPSTAEDVTTSNCTVAGGDSEYAAAKLRDAEQETFLATWLYCCISHFSAAKLSLAKASGTRLATHRIAAETA